MHLQTTKPQAKIITVTYGKIYDVAVDLRKNSKTFGKYVGIVISDKSDFLSIYQMVLHMDLCAYQKMYC